MNIHEMNEPVAAIIVGLLLSLSAGVRITSPLLAVNLMAWHQVITLPKDLDWLGTEPTMIILIAAAVAETLVHFIPAAGTWLKALATPLAFVAGTLLMAAPLSGHNPLYQWTLAAFAGGGLATLTHMGVTGVRAASAPLNVASMGIFGLIWNVGEFLISGVLALLGFVCVIAGWGIALVCLLGLVALLVVVMVKAISRRTMDSPVIS